MKNIVKTVVLVCGTHIAYTYKYLILREKWMICLGLISAIFTNTTMNRAY
jgi:hypothetical protein